MTIISRRTALGGTLAGVAAACTRPAPRTGFDAASLAANGFYAHGVASGDPSADGFVLWTRISPSGVDRMSVPWEVAEDEAFTSPVASGEALARFENDFTVKAVVSGLKRGARYFYRFGAGENLSPVGRARTLPEGAVASAKFAFLSCSNFPFGYFNVYDLVARQTDLDAVVHLGDYIYEYGGSDGEYGAAEGKRLGRPHDPPHEARTLSDYRTRYAQYRSDPSLQAAHAAHSFIMIWDDHETANDSWSGGAQNHTPATEGEWAERKRAAIQAYYEWMPIREPDAANPREAIFRSYSFGDLLTLTALETRLMARAKPFEYDEIVPLLFSADGAPNKQAVKDFRDNVLWAADREMMGAAQLDFVRRSFAQSVAAGQPWRLIANQVTMANVTAPNLEPHVTEEDLVALEAQWDQARAFVKFSTLGLPTNLDAWDGYPAARERFYATAKETGADGIVVLTGDTHTWWANDLVSGDGDHMGVELGVHSVTSPSPYHRGFLGGKGAEYALLTGRDNKDVRYISGEDHGYISLTVTREEVDARYMAVDTIEAPSYQAFEKVGFRIRKSAGAAQYVDVDGLNLAERAVF